jgi:hypothetical protein
MRGYTFNGLGPVTFSKSKLTSGSITMNPYRYCGRVPRTGDRPIPVVASSVTMM